MGPEITPEDLRQAEFKTVLRGADRDEVAATLETAAERLEAMEKQIANLQERLSQADVPDLQSEFEAVGGEVTGILQAAREAANSMRERASADTTRWRSEAMSEVEESRRSAAADAEALRRDAWVTGTELLEQAQRLAKAMRDQAERDILTIQGEAEREAHRLTSGARREAEDMVRTAAMDVEKMVVDATRRRDDIIAQANRQASAAQERTRALEQRRDELLEELESVRATLTRLEGGLEERKDRLDVTNEPSSVKVVHPGPADAAKFDQWALGETVRVVPPEDRPRYPLSPLEDIELESEPQRHPETPVDEPRSEPEPSAGIEEADAERVDEPEVEDDVESLFASLRHTGEDAVEDGEAAGAAEEPVGDDPDAGHDWIDERDSRLLPITNRALRGVKKAMTEMQNIALDGLRTDDEWRPAEEPIADAVRADLIALWTESYAAGHSVAELMTGSKLKRPATPHAETPVEFAAAVGDAVNAAIQGAGPGQRERQSAAARVFRLWRSDEADRWMRETAILAYELGIEDSLSVSASTDAD